jgi:hypothetical protein
MQQRQRQQQQNKHMRRILRTPKLSDLDMLAAQNLSHCVSKDWKI